MKIAVIGAGGWGTTIAELLGKNGFEVSLWVHSKKTFNAIKIYKENLFYLEGVKIQYTKNITLNLRDAVYDSDLIISALPSQKLREIISFIKPSGHEIVVNLAKGIEIGTFKRMSEIIHELWNTSYEQIATLSGPNFSYEIARQMPAATVIGCISEKTSREIQDIFMNDHFRVYYTTDITGVEIGGSLKNVYAIAAGISDGLQFGDSSKASLIIRSISELVKFGEILGGRKETFVGLSGMGDLVATSFSKRSRNRWAGEEIGKGKTIEEVFKLTPQVLEGIYTTKAAFELKEKLNLEMPILTSLYNIMYNKMDPKIELIKLMQRPGKSED
jgi:glycerol-3-phosphate dehydrogenase (NAD(P)+)